MRQYFRSDAKQIDIKDNHTKVTIADKQINQLVIDRVGQSYPQHGVNGEEASVNEHLEQVWVCDPIDGTNGFITGEPTSVFSLAFVEDGVPTVAVVYDPYQDRLYSAIRGEGAECNGTRLRVSTRGMTTSTILGPGSFREVERTQTFLRALADRGASVRTFGGLVFKGCLLAEGRVEGFVFPGRGAHDIAAVKLIVEEAGGRVTDLIGHEQRYDRPIRGAIVSNGVIHDELLHAVQDFGAEEYLGY